MNSIGLPLSENMNLQDIAVYLGRIQMFLHTLNTVKSWTVGCISFSLILFIYRLKAESLHGWLLLKDTMVISLLRFIIIFHCPKPWMSWTLNLKVGFRRIWPYCENLAKMFVTLVGWIAVPALQIPTAWVGKAFHNKLRKKGNKGRGAAGSLQIQDTNTNFSPLEFPTVSVFCHYILLCLHWWLNSVLWCSEGGV